MDNIQYISEGEFDEEYGAEQQLEDHQNLQHGTFEQIVFPGQSVVGQEHNDKHIPDNIRRKMVLLLFQYF